MAIWDNIWGLINPQNVYNRVNNLLFGGAPEKPDLSDIRASEWENYLNTLNEILKGNMPEQVNALASSIQKEAQASGSNLLNKAMSKMAAQGTLKSGLANQVARDVASMTASNTANLLNRLYSQVWSSAFSALPTAIQAERSTKAKEYQLGLTDYELRQQMLNNLMQALGGILSNTASISPTLLTLLGG